MSQYVYQVRGLAVARSLSAGRPVKIYIILRGSDYRIPPRCHHDVVSLFYCTTFGRKYSKTIFFDIFKLLLL